MTPRTQQILEAVIREFIETGEPVSSGYLYKKYDFDAKPATIRNELSFLDTEHFLEQLHTSGGRVPTDKGYQFLVERIMAELKEDLKSAAQNFTENIKQLRQELARRDFHDFIRDLSDELGVLSVGYIEPDGEVYKTGLYDLFRELTAGVNEPREIFQVVEDFELLDERVASLLNYVSADDQPRVFIGKSPITKSRELSVIADHFDIDGNRFIVAAIGPKRMDYERNIGFFRKMKENLSSNW